MTEDALAATAMSCDMGEMIWRSDVEAGSRRHQEEAAPAANAVQALVDEDLASKVREQQEPPVQK